MAISITDPELQSQLEADYRAGRVPRWNPNDADEAQAYVTYFNTLTGTDAMRLVPTTTYKFEIIIPEEEPR